MSDIQVLMTNNAEPSDVLGGGARGVVSRRNLFDREIMRQAAIDALRKLDPRIQVKNPVMFVVLVGTIVTLIYSRSPTPASSRGWSRCGWR